MRRSRNYWTYSASLVVAWAIGLILTLMIRGRQSIRPYLLTFSGFCIGWVSTTIARYIYPPPKHWEANSR